MKKIFFWLLRQYSVIEAERIAIHEVLNEQIQIEYSDLPAEHNSIYDHYIEFLMGIPYLKWCVRKQKFNEINEIKNGLYSKFDDALRYIHETYNEDYM